ncbi:MAG TPA: hypothetical protein VJM12_17375 [Pyrinomonadaceae bacterium]|nr:hypothetical protein [Pyrinomonadaceae bacterium]
MVTKARTIKLTDLTKAIDSAVQQRAGKKLAGGIICGRICPPELASEADRLARSVTKDVSAALPGARLTPKVIRDGDIIFGFVLKPPVETL